MTRTRWIGDTAVVLGASIAGLCAARELSERFRSVVVLDRDTLPDGPEARRLVPQGRHPHLLLPSGARLFERWFPGITAELRAEGATELDLCADFHWYQGGGLQRRPRTTLRTPAMSRPLLEWTVRRRVAALAGVEIRDGVDVTGLTVDSAGQRVTGVRVGDAETLSADLVVDATGRAARSLAWLQELGFEPPPTTVVQIDTRYVTRVLRRTEAPARDWSAAAAIGAPETKRVAMLLPIEGDRWLATIAAVNGTVAPMDAALMAGEARSVGGAAIADVIEASEPLGDAVVHRFPTNQRRHVERMRRFPLGWVLLGDAVCSFDPIYGQGMSSAARQVVVLGAALDRSGTVNTAFARRYFRAAARSVAAPWSIAVGGDFAYDGTTGQKPFATDLLNRYMDRVVQAGRDDDRVARRMNEVVALVRRPEWLLTPAFVLRVWRAARRVRDDMGLIEGRLVTSVRAQST